MGLEDFGTGVEEHVIRYAGIDLPNSVLKVSEGKKISSVESSFNFKLSQWASVGDNTFLASSNTLKQLPAGKYRIERTESGFIFIKQNVNNDDYIEFTGSLVEKVVQEITQFWEVSAKFSKNGFLHRRGYLFYGPQGSGKSILVQQIMQKLINNNGVVFQGSINPSILSAALEVYRKVEPYRPTICLFEDIDSIIRDFGEDQLLSFLDGDNELNHILNIATTNYPERLDKRIVARPRRFDRRIKISMPEASIRSQYLEKKFPDLGKELVNSLVIKTENFSFAALADLVISIKCFDLPADDAILILRDLLMKKVSSEDFKDVEVGFVKNGNS